MLWHLEKFFVFDSYVRTENDTLEGKSVHTGRARCQQKTCLSKGKAATYTYTTRSKMHSAMLQCVRTAFDGASKRGCPKAREDELPAKRGGRQLCLEESFSRKDIVTPEVLRKTCTSWTAHNRAFIGMTCHWIGQDLRRQHGTLACKEIKPANLHAQLEEVAPAVVKLPKHYRCGAHTLNLIATADVQSVAEWNQGLRAPFTKAAAKAQGTWNLQNRSSVVANSIKEKTGRKLKTYCSLMDVLSNPDKMRALNEILSKGGVATFDERDKHILSEYLKVMQPVAECLDSLQSEANAYMGTFMPNLQLMRVQLETLKVDRQEEEQPEERKERMDKFPLLLSSTPVPEVRRQEEVEETIVKTLEDWKRKMVDIPLSPNLFPTATGMPGWTFSRGTNTPLPSSAAVERLFSSAGDILRPKRSSLSNINFEQLVFVRGNMHLLGYKEV
ncbi:hypothetical protein GWK47_054739 [Chionoecetes opilio]|uniref:HAT C-terminal dimerisation domain-containing protein n=1 Tax=Chionoecetes opilio TaxID=41210 RepID=A0A8J4Y5T9_CHIOP|nr:hypothetical protein GWK47_054739 [Chionoecetes opilio]